MNFRSHQVCTFLLLLGLAGCHKSAASEDKQSEEPSEVTVHTAPLEERELHETVAGLGRCEAPPGTSAMLTAAVEGRVVQLLAQPGARISAGQPVVQLDKTLAEANLQEKKTARDSQVASLELLQSRPRPAELNSAELAIQQAKLGVDKAAAVVEHLRPLRSRNEISESVMHEAELALDQARLQQKTAQAQYDVLVLPPRPQAIAEAKSRVTMAEAAVATAEAQLRQLTIAAPIEGLLDTLACQLGQTLAVGAAVGQVVDNRQMHAVVWLTAADARRVKPDDSAALKAESLALAGKVVSIGAVADPQTGNLPVRILIVTNEKGDSPRLVVGQPVSAAIIVKTRKTLAAPARAIQDLGEGPQMSTVVDGAIAILRPKLGEKDDEWVEVTGEGVKPGVPVVIEGGYNVPEKTKVSVAAEPKE